MKGPGRSKGGGDSSIPGRKKSAGTNRKEWCMGPGARSSTAPDIKQMKGKVTRNGVAKVHSGHIMRSCGRDEKLGFVLHEQLESLKSFKRIED